MMERRRHPIVPQKVIPKLRRQHVRNGFARPIDLPGI